jgi:Acetyltransferase (GNAT) domain
LPRCAAPVRPCDDMNAMEIELLEPSRLRWNDLDELADRTVFQTREWLDFVADTQSAAPVVAKLLKHGEVAGYFTGLIIQRFGIKILGSPFPGWTTNFMGFNMMPGFSPKEFLGALEELAFRELKCMHVEVCDRNLRVEDGLSCGFSRYEVESYEMNLDQPEDEILAQMSRQCRGNMRKAERCGVQIEEARDLSFAADYYKQLEEVFARQNLVPTYSRQRVEKLIQYLLPTGNLLLLRARDESGNCIATGLWVGMNKFAQFWGNASLKSGQRLRPNEALHWHAIRYWRNRGIKVLNWGGGRYKRKYGVTLAIDSRFSKSRFRVLQALRNSAQRMIGWRQSTIGRMRMGRYPT